MTIILRVTILIGLLTCKTILTQAQENNFPKEINLIFEFLLEVDYPEKFGEQSYQFRPIRWQIIDIDSDGVTEVFLQTFPHFRQSPTITLFQIDKNDKVTRITEGLAPGHLVALSPEDDYFTPHATGTAVDMQLNSPTPEKLRTFASASLKFGMSVVLYKNFIHTDKREGPGNFIDLSHLEDFESESSCSNFQFEQPDMIVAGNIKGQKNPFFVAKVNNELFCYSIAGFTDSKFIEKEISIINLPKNFKEFQLHQNIIKYVNKKGKLIELEL